MSLKKKSDKVNARTSARLDEIKAVNPSQAAEIAKNIDDAYDSATGTDPGPRVRLAGAYFARACLEYQVSGKKRHKRHMTACGKLIAACHKLHAAKKQSNPGKRSSKKRKKLKARIRKGTRKLQAREL